MWFCLARLGVVPKWVAMQIALAQAQMRRYRPDAIAFSVLHFTVLTLDLITNQRYLDY